MSKMNELSMLLDDLIECGNRLTSVAEGLKAYFSNTDESHPEPAVTKSDPEPTVSLTFEDVRKVLAAKSSMEEGKYKAQVKDLVTKYSTTGNLKGVPPESFEALMADAEVIGNG